MADKVDFIKVHKNGVVLEIHPSTVESHKSQGWAVTEPNAKATPIEEVPGYVAPEAAPEEAKAKK